jgi:hypothetical protein
MKKATKKAAKAATRKAAAQRTPARAAKVSGAKAQVFENQQDQAEEAQAQQRQAADMMRPARCRAFMRRELAKQFPEIMEGFVEAAKTGSVPHVKLATELLKPTRKSVRRRSRNVAELLDKLRRNEPFEEPAESMRWSGTEYLGEVDRGA